MSRDYAHGVIHTSISVILVIAVLAVAFTMLGLMSVPGSLALGTVSCLYWLAALVIWFFWG